VDFYLQGRGFFLKYQTDRNDSAGFDSLVGIRGRVSEKLTVSADTGFKAQWYDRSDVRDYFNWTMQGVANYQWTPLFNVSLRMKRDIVQAVSSTGGYYEANRADLEFKYKMTTLISLDFGGSIQLNNYPTSEVFGDETIERFDTISEGRVNLSYQPFNHIELSVGYRLRVRDSNVGGLDYAEHYIGSSASVFV